MCAISLIYIFCCIRNYIQSHIIKCSYENLYTKIEAATNITFLELYNLILSSYHFLKEGTVRLSYSLNNGQYVQVNNDRDVWKMMRAQLNIGAECIDIRVEKGVGSSNMGSTSDVMESQEESYRHLYHKDDNVVERRERLSDFWRNYIKEVGQKFMGGVTEFRTKLQMYAAEMGFEYVLVKNNPVHVTAICSRRVSELCCWRVHASFCKEDGSFSIRTLNNKHSCTGIIRKNSRTVLSSKVIVMLIEHLLRKDPSYSPIKVVKYIDDSFCLRVPYRVAHYALEKCREKVHGDEDESFNRLARYVKLIMTSNPGSHCTLDIDSRTRRFERVFISFDASIKGFRMCRPLVFFDGTHLRNKYQGTLLVAVAKDANQG